MKDNLKTLYVLGVLAGEIQPRINEADCLQTLQRRMAFVEETIRTRRGSEGGLRYARAERNALRWAIDKLGPILAAEKAEHAARRAA